MNNKALGTSYVLLSAVFYASYGVWSRLMVGAFGEFSQAWTRGLLLLLVVVLLNFRLKFFKKVKGADWKWFLSIALAGGINQAPYFLGFEHLNIGTATLLFYASLVVGGYLLGKVFFGEKMSLVKIVSLVVAILGMLTIYGFSLRANQIFPASMTVLAGLLGASTVVLPKKLVGSYHELQIMSGYFVMQVVVNLPISLLLNNPLPPLELSTAWLGQLGYAAAMMLANLLAIAGFARLEASIASLIGLAEILLGVVFGVWLFGEIVTPGVWLGGGLIVLAAALPSLAEYRISLRGVSPKD